MLNETEPVAGSDKKNATSCDDQQSDTKTAAVLLHPSSCLVFRVWRGEASLKDIVRQNATSKSMGAEGYIIKSRGDQDISTGIKDCNP